MSFTYCTPEEAGISSKHVMDFYRALEGYGLSTHSVILARGDRIFSENYYAPFTPDFKHRMYSVSKTFVSMAVGFCIQDGLISLDDPMAKFFPEYLEGKAEEYIPTTTIRELLKMETSMEYGVNWFKTGCSDRTEVYFRKTGDKLPNTMFSYDSSGSYMLGVIVEKLTGMPFLKYLQTKVLDDIGFSKDAYCIKAPGGHSFGDSGIMCTSRDLLLFSRFILNGGTYNGKRYLNAEYVKDATTMKSCTNDFGFESNSSWGYGYQIWGAPDGGFAMHGMGNQISICDPKRDFIFIITSDNQGHKYNYEQIFHALYLNVIMKLNDGEALPPDGEAKSALDEYLAGQKLFCLRGASSSPFGERICGKTFDCGENPMGIKWFRLDLEGDEGSFTYENAQGEKVMTFGFGHNVFGKFPETGYSDLTATIPEEGNMYDAAFSADWCEEMKLRLRVQIIDKYFGNLAILFGFRDENAVTVKMVRAAEAFLREYDGIMIARARDEKVNE